MSILNIDNMYAGVVAKTFLILAVITQTTR